MRSKTSSKEKLIIFLIIVFNSYYHLFFSHISFVCQTEVSIQLPMPWATIKFICYVDILLSLQIMHAFTKGTCLQCSKLLTAHICIKGGTINIYNNRFTLLI